MSTRPTKPPELILDLNLCRMPVSLWFSRQRAMPAKPEPALRAIRESTKERSETLPLRRSVVSSSVLERTFRYVEEAGNPCNLGSRRQAGSRGFGLAGKRE